MLCAPPFDLLQLMAVLKSFPQARDEQKLDFLTSFPNFFWIFFYWCLLRENHNGNLLRTGSNEKNFMAFLLLSTTRCYFFSLLFFMRQRKKIYCNLKKNFLLSLWWNWEVFSFYFACVKRSSILEYKRETFMLLFFNLN